ncbi:hypothetical protein EVAR_38613_1 [Eumeta japonica]|uniref:Uncharacterized protein n=1 Tax=Eumeta variegata TaxID=151549 RepID=A0A4C1WTI1_EUMVA|nr:hypothetical protein EVAR_38613_1 [Eumeta japonica]
MVAARGQSNANQTEGTGFVARQAANLNHALGQTPKSGWLFPFYEHCFWRVVGFMFDLELRGTKQKLQGFTLRNADLRSASGCKIIRYGNPDTRYKLKTSTRRLKAKRRGRPPLMRAEVTGVNTLRITEAGDRSSEPRIVIANRTYEYEGLRLGPSAGAARLDPGSIDF